MLKIYVALLLSTCLMLCGCATTYNPATGQKELIFINTSTEVSIGNMIAAKVSRQFKVSKDSRKIDRVTMIGEKIVGVNDRKDLKYHFNVIEEDGLNAFTTPGGHIYINSGLIEKTSDDELACVIGHEIGHVAARHIAKKIQAQIGYDILVNIALSKSGTTELRRASSIGFDLLLRGYSREDELLADRLGVKYAYKAGYDPYAMISFLKQLRDSKKEKVGFGFLRTHPYISQRIKMLEMEIPAIVDKADKKTTAGDKPTEQQKTLNPKSVASSEKRPLKVMCPSCRKIFSGKTRYCPYDGTKL